jgi:choline-sulfatase
MLLAFSLALLLGAGCRLFVQAPPKLADLNVLLVVIDTIGAKHTGLYNPQVTFTPNIDKLAAGGVRFARSYATAPWTKPAIASIVTGKMPTNHGVTAHESRLGADQPTLAKSLKLLGFKTLGAVSHLYVSAEAGFAQGFDAYEEVTSKTRMHKIVTSAKVSDKALAWLGEYSSGKKEAPFFMFLHYFDPHYNYQHHPEFDQTPAYEGPIKPGMNIRKLRELAPHFRPGDIEYLQGLYHEIAFTDFHIGRVLERLKELGLSGRTLVILAADHGEEFMEHGWIGHTRTLYEELIRVPLIISLPGVFGTRVVEAPVSQIDIAATLVDMAGQPKTESVDGVSLLPLLMGGRGSGPRELISEVSFESPTIQDGFKTALMQGDYKLIHDRRAGTWQLYNLRADPDEKHDQAKEAPEMVKEMSARVTAWEARSDAKASGQGAPQVAPNQEELEQLKSLGYM